MKRQRGYQQRTKAALRAAWAKGALRVLLTLPTGAGKTALIAYIAAEAARRGWDVLGLAHRDELVTQMGEAFEAEVGPGAVGYCKAGRPDGLRASIVMASVQTAYARLPQLAARYAGRKVLIVIDECHRAAGRQYKVVLYTVQIASGKVRVVGLSATPYRLDNEPLGKRANSDDEPLFEELIEPVTFKWLADNGECPACFAELPAGAWCLGTAVKPHPGVQVPRAYLVRPRFLGAGCPPTARPKRGTDYTKAKEEAAAKANTVKLVANAADTYLQEADGRAGIGCAVDVAHAEALAAELDGRRASWRRPLQSDDRLAEYVHGGTPPAQRDLALARLACGKTKMLYQCQLLLEGWDSASDHQRARRLFGDGVHYVPLEVLSDNAPTASRSKYMQALGRITRSHPAKSGALYLGHAGNEDPDTGGFGHPDDHYGFSLEHQPRPEQYRGVGDGTPGDGTGPGLLYCTKCMAVHAAGTTGNCWGCGTPLPAPGREVVVLPGQLVEVSEAIKTKVDIDFEHLLKQAHAMGYGADWAVQNFEVMYRRKLPPNLRGKING